MLQDADVQLREGDADVDVDIAVTKLRIKDGNGFSEVSELVNHILYALPKLKARGAGAGVCAGRSGRERGARNECGSLCQVMEASVVSEDLKGSAIKFGQARETWSRQQLVRDHAVVLLQIRTCSATASLIDWTTVDLH